MARTKRTLSYEKVKSRYGYVFISLWLVGFALLCLLPFVTSIVYSFNKVTVTPGKLQLDFVGIKNYHDLIFGDASFLPYLSSTVTNAAYKTPLIVLFSMFVGLLLNQDFKGRSLVRGVFFLPVIVMTGPVRKILTNDAVFSMGMSGEQKGSAMLEITSAADVLENLGLNPMVSDYIIDIVNQVFNLSWNSGIQILIFISALQSVPDTYYEVASIEGATGWEAFWKITVPSIAPMTVVAIVYTMIDMLLGDSSAIYSLIHYHVTQVNIAYAATVATLGFFAFSLLVLLVFYIANRKVQYATE